MGYDLIIRGGSVVDGTGLKAFTADVAIEGGRIARIGRIDADADRIFDADGLVVSAGLHRHPYPLRRAARLGSDRDTRLAGTGSPP